MIRDVNRKRWYIWDIINESLVGESFSTFDNDRFMIQNILLMRVITNLQMSEWGGEGGRVSESMSNRELVSVEEHIQHILSEV